MVVRSPSSRIESIMSHSFEGPRPGKGHAIRKLLGVGSDGTRILRLSNSVLVLSVLIALISLTVLYDKNRKLQQETLLLRSNAQALAGTIAGSPSAQVGDLLPSFHTQSLDGAKSSVVYDGRSKYLFYIFSPQCGVCIAELPTWNRIAAPAKLRNYRVVALSIYSDAGLEEKPGLVDRNFETLRIPSVAIQRAYRVLSLPMVMLVSEEGKVQWVRYGKLPEDTVRELLSVIDAEKQ